MKTRRGARLAPVDEGQEGSHGELFLMYAVLFGSWLAIILSHTEWCLWDNERNCELQAKVQ